MMSDFSNQLDSTLPQSIRKAVQRGLFFNGTYMENLAAATSRDFLIIAGAKKMHLSIDIPAETAMDFFGYSGTTYSAAGTPINIINDNFSSSITPLGTININATITSMGTVRYSKYLPGGNGPQAVGGENGPSREFILNANGVFAIRLTNNGAQPSRYSIEIGWYED